MAWINQKYSAMGGANGVMGQAVSVVETYYYTPYTAQPYRCRRTYQNGAIYWWNPGSGYEVHGEIWRRYQSMGAESGWLGFPNSDETSVANFSGYGRYSQFAGGRIYWYPDSGAFEVRNLSDISTEQKNSGLRRAVGKRYLLTILIDPKDPDYTMPSADDVEAALYGTRIGYPLPDKARSNVRDFYLENSRQQLTLENAGIIYLPAPANKQGKHYWDDSKHMPCANDGWINNAGVGGGHSERVADAIKSAAEVFDFKIWDARGNNDNVLTPDELAVLVVSRGEKGKDSWGDVGTTYGGFSQATWLACTMQSPQPIIGLKVDGVTIKTHAEWFAPAPIPTKGVQLGLPAHELAHLLTGIPDLYNAGWRFDSGLFSRMGASCSACAITHHDPFMKLKAGWLNYSVAAGTEYIYPPGCRDPRRSSDAVRPG